MKNADRSTFLHESAHLFLEMKSELALDEDASPHEREDMQTLLRWFGFNGTIQQWRALTDEQRREAHEQFARAFEKYLGEGKAPVPELQPMFARFRAWLLGVYKSLSRIPNSSALNDDVRKVMDRMLATQTAIDAAQQDAGVGGIFTDAGMAGVSPAVFDAYRTQLQGASEEARAALQVKFMRELAREQERWWQEQRTVVRGEVAAEVYARPVYQALAAMRGTQPDGTPLPDGHAVPLSRDALVEQFGPAVLETLPRPYLYSAHSGLAPDTVAEIFGFANGEALLEAIRTAPPQDQVIDALTDERMLERHGTLLREPEHLTEAAREAVAGQGRDKVIRTELGFLRNLVKAAAPAVRAQQTEDRAERRAAGERLRAELPDDATLQTAAQQHVAGMRLRDIAPDRFYAVARRASRQATELAAAGKYEEAIAAKKKELVNLALFRAATAAREAVSGAREEFAKMFGADKELAKRRNMDYVHAARMIAATYFFPEKRLGDARTALDLVKKHDTDTYDLLKERIDAALAEGTELSTLSFESFQVMREAVADLWEMSLRQQQNLVNGQLVDRNEAIDAMIEKLDTVGAPPEQEPRNKAQMMLLGVRAALRRVESWVSDIDQGSITGPMRTYLWAPVSEAVGHWRTAKVQYLQQYLAIVKPIETTVVPGRIVATELGHVFESRAQLLHALLHTGNESNFQKLLRGYKWGEYRPDGTLDSSKWQAFIDRAYREGLVTKADMDYVQGVWDLLDSLKPQAQAAHREMFGRYFNEITAWPVETPFGTYRGGYVPAIVDELQSADASVRNEKDLTEGGNAHMFPSTGKGFTKQREEYYAKPLELDLRMVPAHIDRVLRFIHIEPRVREVGRMLWTRRFREKLNAYDPTVVGDMLVPWLQRAASQRVAKASTGWAGKAADSLFRTLRTRTGLNMMVANVANTLQQFTGLLPSAVLVKPRYLRSALYRYVTEHKTTVAQVQEASEFMRTRMTSQAMEIMSTIDDLLLNPSKYDQVRAFGNRHGYFMQEATQNIVDVITWVGAYDQAMSEASAEGGNVDAQIDGRPAKHDAHVTAVRAADRAVRETQGSFAPEDIASVDARGPFVRLFVMFFGYFNTIANLNATELHRVARDMGLRKGAGRGLYVYAMGFAAPAILSELLMQAIQGGGDDDDDDDGWMSAALAVLFGSQVRTGAAMVPGGSIGLAAYNYWNDKPYDDRISTSPAIQMLESALRSPHSVYQSIVEDKPRKRAVRDTIAAIALLTGLPVGALSRPLGYLADVADDKTHPEDAVDVARGLVTGHGAR